MISSNKKIDSWIINPVWKYKEGYFLPVDWSVINLSNEAEKIIVALQNSPVQNASVLLRGSIIEQSKPHFAADIDILILTENLRKLRFDFSALTKFGRFLDIVCIDISNERDEVLYTLARTRSIHICGNKFSNGKIKVSKQLLVDHWLKYAPFRLPNILSSVKNRRLSEVKQIIRSVGIIYFLKYNKFSRDIRTCINWAKIESKEIGEEVEQLFKTVSSNKQTTFDIRKIKAWLKFNFYSHINNNLE